MIQHLSSPDFSAFAFAEMIQDIISKWLNILEKEGAEYLKNCQLFLAHKEQNHPKHFPITATTTDWLFSTLTGCIIFKVCRLEQQIHCLMEVPALSSSSQ